MRKWIVVGLALLSLAACVPYPYYYRDGYYRYGYNRPYYPGYYSDRGGYYYRGDGRYYAYRDYYDR